MYLIWMGQMEVTSNTRSVKRSVTDMLTDSSANQNNSDVFLWLWIVWSRFIGHSGGSLNVNIKGHRCSHQWCVCFLASHVGTHKQFILHTVYWLAWIKREIGSVFEQRGNTNERRWRRARGGNARAHRPSSSSWCRHACQRTDRRRPANLSVCDWAESLWAAMGNRSMKKVALLLVSESPENILSHLCGERLIRLLKPLCVLDEDSVYLIEAVTAGLKFTEQWCVECAFSKGHEGFVMFCFKQHFGSKPSELPV